MIRLLKSLAYWSMNPLIPMEQELEVIDHKLSLIHTKQRELDRVVLPPDFNDMTAIVKWYNTQKEKKELELADNQLKQQYKSLNSKINQKRHNEVKMEIIQP
jgi:phosphoketolase